MHFDHIIKNATIVNAHETFEGHIYVKDEKIFAITQDIIDGEADEITDASGKFVLPGFIDTHVHSRDGANSNHAKEDFFHSSSGAAASGLTTIFEMPNTSPAIHDASSLSSLIDCITPKANVDFGVWGLCLGPINNHKLLELSKAGVIGFKYFWGYAIDSKTYQLIYNYREGMEDVLPPLDFGQIYDMFRHVKATGQKIAIHAENFEIIKFLTKEVMDSGDKTYAGLLKSRPAMAEVMIVQDAIELSREIGTQLHILHVAAGGSVAHIRRAKADGLPVTAETCIQHLMLTDEDGEKLGAAMKGYPLVRTKADQDKIWEGLLDGTIDYVCSDHAPHTAEEKQQPLWDAPAGCAMTEVLPRALIDAVSRGKLTINKLAYALSEQPAKLYGIYPEKGSIKVGTDADIVLIDMEATYVYDQAKMHSKMKHSPFHGRTFKGKPVQTILRGKTVAKDGEIVSEPTGKFIRPSEQR